ncbi:unnamed protein product [Cunninghamella echinulata]
MQQQEIIIVVVQTVIFLQNLLWMDGRGSVAFTIHKHCQSYGANIRKNDKLVYAEIINRYVNASRNIRRILVSFIENNGQGGYRPEALRRQVSHQPVHGRDRDGRGRSHEEDENINGPDQQPIRGRSGRGRNRGGRGRGAQAD